jgi:hypothetical protein
MPRIFTHLLCLALTPSLALTASLASTSIAQARSLGPFPETNRQRAQTSVCFVNTADGRSFDLTKLCGRSTPAESQGNRASRASQSTGNDNGSRASNDGTEGADRPIDNSPDRPQCYVVDTDGSPCG